MLNMMPTNDKKLLDNLSFNIFAEPFKGEVGYVFYSDKKPVGFAKLNVGDTSSIKAIGILPKQRGKGLGDFFTRSILFRLTQISRYIKVEYKSDYFIQFGFKTVNNHMEIESDKLKFIENHNHC